jgi:hypothetical protein
MAFVLIHQILTSTFGRREGNRLENQFTMIQAKNMLPEKSLS